jgi:ubiquinone/menaquinone biosynthesis C-methylase UbiE
MDIPLEGTVAEFERHQDELLSFTGAYFGEKNLDVGCGNGIASAYQQKKLGIHPTLVDVADIRHPVAQELPFFLIRDNVLPFEDTSFDSSYMQYALHHIPTESVLPLLGEIFRVSKRFILLEEVTNSKTNVEKAKAFDDEVNAKIHPGAHMPVYKYYSPEEIGEMCKSFGRSIQEHKVIFEGVAEHGDLETHLFVIS